MSYPSLSRVGEGFILHISAAGRSPHTIRNYQTDLQRFYDWNTDVEVDQVGPKHIEDFMVYPKNDFQITHIGGKTPAFTVILTAIVFENHRIIEKIRAGKTNTMTPIG